MLAPETEDPGLGAGDLNGDGSVGFDDFLVLANNFGNEAERTEGDLNGDGVVGFDDFLTLSSNFGTKPVAVEAVFAGYGQSDDAFADKGTVVWDIADRR